MMLFALRLPPIITSLRWFLLIEHYPYGVDEPFLLFVVTLFFFCFFRFFLRFFVVFEV